MTKTKTATKAADSRTVTNRDIRAAAAVLPLIDGVNIPIRGSFAIAKAAKIVMDANKTLEKELQKLRESHGARDENGKLKTEPFEANGQKGERYVMTDPAAFNTDSETLLDQDADITGLVPVSIDMLGDIALPPTILRALDFVIVAGNDKQ